ncbi:MAG: glycosyltransferase [Pseudanabaenaceae cyanobacterium]
MDTAPDLLVVGAQGSTHVGGSLVRSDRRAVAVSPERANSAWPWLNRVVWRWRKGPPHPDRLARAILETCDRHPIRAVLVMGIAPVEAPLLARLRQRGIATGNFLTDDPWQPFCRSRWLLRALPRYDVLFTPRRANMTDLQKLGAPSVVYLPFAYDPDLFFPVDPVPALASDVFFAGGGDRDRVPYIAALTAAGISVGLYGGYWERFPETKPLARGMADPSTLRQAASSAKVGLCLVRRANRDGHVMRTYELPALGLPMVTEDTPEHRDLFGEEGTHVLYFTTPETAVAQVQRLLTDSARRQTLAQNTQRLICSGGHTYGDRLHTMRSYLMPGTP